jgi:uncharacterized membrane protein YeaQ/YmgE (transglycosylase-associated protein family)
MMDVLDLLVWLSVGLLAGWLAGFLRPDAAIKHRRFVVAAGVAGALLGGVPGWLSTANSAFAFLIATTLAVGVAVSCSLMLQRDTPTHYHT